MGVVHTFVGRVPFVREPFFHVLVDDFFGFEDHARSGVILEELPVPYACRVVGIDCHSRRLYVPDSLVDERERLERVEVVERENFLRLERDRAAVDLVVVFRYAGPSAVVFERDQIRTEYVKTPDLSSYRVFPYEAGSAQFHEGRDVFQEIVLYECEVFVVELFPASKVRQMKIEACRLRGYGRYRAKDPPLVCLKVVGLVHRAELEARVFSSKPEYVVVPFGGEKRANLLEDFHFSSRV